MNNFKDFGIKPEITAFSGDKIKINRVLNIPITVLDYKIEDSKAKPGTKLLTLHIKKEGTMHIIFTGSKVLTQMIQRVPENGFPFQTTIIKQNESFEFT